MLSLLPLMMLVSVVTVLDHSCEEEGFVCKFDYVVRGTYVFQQKHQDIGILEVDRFPDSAVDVTNLPTLQRFEIGPVDLLPENLCQCIILGLRCVKVSVKEEPSKSKLCCPSSTTIPTPGSTREAKSTPAATASTPSDKYTQATPSDKATQATQATLTSTQTPGSNLTSIADPYTTVHIVMTIVIVASSCIIIPTIIYIIRHCRKKSRLATSDVEMMSMPSNPLPLDEGGSEDTLFSNIMGASFATRQE